MKVTRTSEGDSHVREEPGFIFRVPRGVLPAISEISERTGIPRSVVTRILLDHAISDPPKWMKDAMSKRVAVSA